MAEAHEEVVIGSPAELREWLSRHHATSPGIWLTTYKSGDPRHVTYDEVVDEAIAFGWVDSRPRRLDDARSQRLLTPRRPGSSWSAVNRARVERLTVEGRMTPAGQAAVDVAKANGAWAALDAVERLEEPDDLRHALATTAGARRHWDLFPPSTRRAILEWIGSAKRPQTRAARIATTATQAAENVRDNQWRQPKGR